MSNTKFTPGPWRVWFPDGINPTCPPDYVYVEPVRGGHVSAVCKVFDPHTSIGSKKQYRNANAHLIAAAPDLYALVADAVEDICEHESDWNKAARAALAKARGEA